MAPVHRGNARHLVGAGLPRKCRPFDSACSGRTDLAIDRWIVTACNGYLGGEVCRALAASRQVVGLARPGRDLGDLENLGVQCRTYEELPQILRPGDVLVHCAGKTGNSGPWEEFERTNVRFSEELYRRAAQGRASCFVYVSSVAAVGYRNRRGREVLDETDPPDLSDGEFYGRSKWAAERRLAGLSREDGMRLVILRPGLIYGRRPAGVPQTWLRRGWIVDPEERVPLVHVDSFLDSLTRVVESRGVRDTFFVVDAEQPTLNELNKLRIELGIIRYHPWRVGRLGFCVLYQVKDLLGRILGRRWPGQPGSWKATLHFHSRRSRYSTDALRKACGWQPALPLAEGLARQAEGRK